MVPMPASAGDWTETWWAHVLYVLAVAAVAIFIHPEALSGVGTGAIAVVGIIGIWRYSWALLHFARSLVYRRVVYPRMRERAIAGAGDPPHAYLLVTSFRIPSETTARVYAAAFRAALAAPGGATVVASIVEMSDERLVKQLYAKIVGSLPDVRLVLVRIAGTGKRDAIAYGLRAIARFEPDAGDFVALIDGDSMVPKDLVAHTAPFLRLPGVGALTTDEVAEVEGADGSAPSRVFRLWFPLRFAQRHVLMSSMGLSERVLTLTGRMSAFRADIACNPDFISMVEVDYIDHWRLGRFKFLTGDDKSTWFWLLRAGYKMLYVPDVQIVTVETPPSPHFFRAAAMLMVRWFGNMLRNNARALALGPNRIGYFTWWTILDQRMSMWTSLTGPVFAILGAIFYTPQMLLFYGVWILISRYAMTIILLSARPRISILYPLLLFFNQVFGSAVKTFIFFRLDRQRWTRQRTTLADGGFGAAVRLRAWSSVYMHGLALAVFLIGIALLMGVIPWPSAWS
jgi:glycosyltransferase Alg8